MAELNPNYPLGKTAGGDYITKAENIGYGDGSLKESLDTIKEQVPISIDAFTQVFENNGWRFAPTTTKLSELSSINGIVIVVKLNKSFTNVVPFAVYNNDDGEYFKENYGDCTSKGSRSDDKTCYGVVTSGASVTFEPSSNEIFYRCFFESTKFGFVADGVEYVYELGGDIPQISDKTILYDTDVESALSDTSTKPVQNKAIKAELDKKYEKPSDGIPSSDLADGVIPTTLPASDVSDWAKASSKPSYNASEISATDSDGNTTDTQSYLTSLALKIGDITTFLESY